ncbi:MAG: hypothetical protein ACREEL_09160 [Stellaceae bacterium]
MPITVKVPTALLAGRVISPQGVASASDAVETQPKRNAIDESIHVVATPTDDRES